MTCRLLMYRKSAKSVCYLAYKFSGMDEPLSYSQRRTDFE